MKSKQGKFLGMNEEFLKEEYEKLHAAGHYSGYFCLKYKERIKELIENTSSHTILDYGCGKGFQYFKLRVHAYWKVSVSCYDKFYKELSILPTTQSDGVICVEVLEHIPENQIDDVLKQIFGAAKKFVFLTVATKEAKKKFSNGENVHILLKDKEWWMQKINDASKGQIVDIIFN